MSSDTNLKTLVEILAKVNESAVANNQKKV
jgi:hypothetical protein